MKKLIIILICLILCGCNDYAELNTLSIVTAIAVDKEEENYKLSVLIANTPKTQTSSKEGEAQTTVYDGKGKTIAEAIKIIDKKTPKKLYFSHVKVVVISDKIGKDGFLKVADWGLRYPQNRDKFYLMQIDDQNASDVLKIISPLESFPSQSIATLIESSKNANQTGNTATYSNFVGKVLEKGYDPIMPTIKINGDVKKGSKQENLETAKPNTYLTLGTIAIYKDDKLIGTTTKEESEIIQILNNEAKELIYNIKEDNKIINIYSNNIKTKIKLKNNNEININVNGDGNIYEINGDINLSKPEEIKKIEKKWNKTLKKDIIKLFNKTNKEYKSDIFGIGNMIYKENPKKWKKIEKQWNKKYLPNLKINVKVNTKIISTGNLTNTLKEGEKWKK